MIGISILSRRKLTYQRIAVLSGILFSPGYSRQKNSLTQLIYLIHLEKKPKQWNHSKEHAAI